MNVAGIEINVSDEIPDLDENRNKRLRSEMSPKLFCVGTLPLTTQYSTPFAQVERDFPLTLY